MHTLLNKNALSLAVVQAVSGPKLGFRCQPRYDERYRLPRRNCEIDLETFAALSNIPIITNNVQSRRPNIRCPVLPNGRLERTLANASVIF